MKKLNSVIYNKLLLQAQEAKTQNLTKLASSIVGALGPIAEDENVRYDYQQLQEEVHQEMWKLATHVIKYYDVESADVQKINDRLEVLAEKFLQEVEESLGVEDVVAGPLETQLPGQINKSAALHRDKRNGYIDFKDRTWGVAIYSKKPPQPGDKVFIDLSYLSPPPVDESFSEEVVAQVVDETRNLKNQIQYFCRIQSQNNAERIMGGKPV